MEYASVLNAETSETILDRVIAGSILLALLTLGFVVALRRVSRARGRQDFLTEFADRFIRYVNGGGKDEALYVELTQRVSRMQRELGHHGIMAMYPSPAVCRRNA